MIDITQLLLGVVIVTLTVLFTVIGVQVYLILRDFRATIRRANMILDDTGAVTNMISGMIMGFKSGGKLMEYIKKKHVGKR